MDAQGLLFSLAEMLTGARLEPMAVADAVGVTLDSKRARGLRHRYLLKLSSALGLFAARFGPRELHIIKPAEIEEWLQNPAWGNETRKGYLQCVRTLFSFGVKRGWCYHNTALKVDAPLSNNEPPGILTVDECARLLCATTAATPSHPELAALQFAAAALHRFVPSVG